MNKKKLKEIISKEGNFKIFCYKRLTCAVLRPHFINRTFEDERPLFHLCGYVFIPEDTKLGKWAWKNQAYLERKLAVHGGVTYFECRNGFVTIGFDAAHSGDLCKFDEIESHNVYRNMEYMTKETKSLVDQLLTLYAQGEMWGDADV